MSDQPWARRRVFVTGATGFIGSWLTMALLKKQAYVVVLVRDWEPHSLLIKSGAVNHTYVVNGALEDYACLERAINEHEIDTVFHLGAQPIVATAHRSPLATFETNIRGTYGLLEACRVHDDLVKRIVVASSDKAYGQQEALPYTEQTSLLACHPYDVSKSCTDMLARTYGVTYKLPVIITRCGNVYGGGDVHWDRLIPGTIRSLHLGQRPIIRSDGQFTRDYVYIDDAVDAYLAAAESADRTELSGEAFNFGPARPRSAIEIVDILRRLMNREELEPVILNEARGEIRDQYLSSVMAQEVLGWTPRHRLEDGLRKTIAWYEAHLKSQDL